MSAPLMSSQHSCALTLAKAEAEAEAKVEQAMRLIEDEALASERGEDSPIKLQREEKALAELQEAERAHAHREEQKDIAVRLEERRANSPPPPPPPPPAPAVAAASSPAPAPALSSSASPPKVKNEEQEVKELRQLFNREGSHATSPATQKRKKKVKSAREKSEKEMPPWNSAPMRPTPPGLKGMKARREPWSEDARVYNKKFGDLSEANFGGKDRPVEGADAHLTRHREETRPDGTMWDSSVFRNAPWQLRGLKPVTREPWCANERGRNSDRTAMEQRWSTSQPDSLPSRHAASVAPYMQARTPPESCGSIPGIQC
jgi:hypothetical protein